MSETCAEGDELDAALRAFAAADAFEQDAAELRTELCRLRAAGRTAPSWGARWELRAAVPAAVPRIAAEAVFLIAAAVFVGVAGYGALTVVLAMAAAWLVVLGIESAMLRERRAAEEPLERDGAVNEESLLDALRPRFRARSRAHS